MIPLKSAGEAALKKGIPTSIFTGALACQAIDRPGLLSLFLSLLLSGCDGDGTRVAISLRYLPA
jgi:hypothetical protein